MASRSVEIRDPRALRALAHPTRLALVGLLRHEGPLTATQAGTHLGQSPASCSFHLRQLAKYGLVEESGGGRGRERPWRATAMFTRWPAIADTPELAAAAELFSAVVAERYFESLMRWLEAKPLEPPEWQEAAQLGDTMIFLTAKELADLGDRLAELAEPYLERTGARELRPPEARMVRFLKLAFPVVGDRDKESGE